MLDNYIARNLAKEFKIDLFTIYREYLQLLFLKHFYAKHNSENIYFKGGTAIKFIFGSFRFSEDLDFTSLLNPSKLAILIEESLKDLNKEVGNVNFKKLDSFTNSFSGKISQNLPDFNFPLTIRLDFSLREKPFFADTSLIETTFPIGPYPQITHLRIEEMLAEKIRALIIRGQGRDIFDIWFLLTKKAALDWNLVNKKMLLYNKNTNMAELLTIIKNMPIKDIKSDLTKFLPLSHRNLCNNIKELTIKKLEEIA